MKKTMVLATMVAMAVMIAFASVALARTFTCRTDPCFGTNQNDVITGTNDADDIRALDGDDGISPQEGNDFVLGGDGDDRMAGAQGNDDLRGNNGNDRIFDQAGDDTDVAVGGAGRDFIDVADGDTNDTVSCGPGRGDTVRLDRGDQQAGCDRVFVILDATSNTAE